MNQNQLQYDCVDIIQEYMILNRAEKTLRSAIIRSEFKDDDLNDEYVKLAYDITNLSPLVEEARYRAQLNRYEMARRDDRFMEHPALADHRAMMLKCEEMAESFEQLMETVIQFSNKVSRRMLSSDEFGDIPSDIVGSIADYMW